MVSLRYCLRQASAIFLKPGFGESGAVFSVSRMANSGTKQALIGKAPTSVVGSRPKSGVTSVWPVDCFRTLDQRQTDITELTKILDDPPR
jgi:hypothetical protein